MITLSGRSTASTRGARWFRSSRMAYSSLPMSTRLLVLATPIRIPEGADRLGRHAAPPQPGDRRHARVVPAAHVAALHQLEQLALAHHRVVEVAARELVLVRPRRRAARASARVLPVIHHPVVERAVVLELQRAEGVRDPLDGVLERVRVVVERVDAPRVARAVVVRVADAVEDRVAHQHVGRGHVDLGAQHVRCRRGTRRRACGGRGRGSPPRVRSR